MFAAHHRLSNLTAVIDNGLQSLDTVENTLSMHPLVDKFAAFLVGMFMRLTVTITPKFSTHFNRAY